MVSEKVMSRVAPDNTILLGYRGSISHGTYVEKYGPESHDDKDLLGIYVAPKKYYLGLGGKKGQQKEVMEDIDGVLWDSVVYEIQKMFRLLLNNNPNVLSLLWLPENLYIKITPAGKRLIENRDIFVSKAAYKSFVGYANAQLSRLDKSSLSTGRMGAKRKKLVEQFGYDTKNASHLIRLLRMGIEFMTEGKLYVLRPDATELVDIKRGKWPLQKVRDEANGLYKLAREAYVRSPLPPEPNFLAAEKILIETIEENIYGKEI